MKSFALSKKYVSIENYERSRYSFEPTDLPFVEATEDVINILRDFPDIKWSFTQLPEQYELANEARKVGLSDKMIMSPLDVRSNRRVTENKENPLSLIAFKGIMDQNVTLKEILPLIRQHKKYLQKELVDRLFEIEKTINPERYKQHRAQYDALKQAEAKTVENNMPDKT